MTESPTKHPFAPRPEPLGIPDTAWNDTPLLCLQVNDQWVSHVLGVMEALAQRETWLGTDSEVDNALNNVDQIIAALMEACDTPVTDFIVGEIRSFGFTALPTGWLACDGSAINRTTYADLFAAIGTAYGVGNGSTTFNLPNAPGRVPVGVGAGTGLTARSLGQSFGEETHLQTNSELARHNHAVAPSAINVQLLEPGTSGTRNYASGAVGVVGVTTTQDAGTSAAFNIMQPSFVVAYGIYAGA